MPIFRRLKYPKRFALYHYGLCIAGSELAQGVLSGNALLLIHVINACAVMSTYISALLIERGRVNSGKK